MLIAYREALRPLKTSPCPRRTVIPPNRLEAGVWDLLANWVSPGRSGSLSALREQLRRLLGQDRIYFSPSARCAIAQILSLLPQREVVMPAFNCDVVKSAVEAAGKQIVYVDVAPGSVNATSAEFAEAARPGRILLATHQFGVPTDIEAICALAEERGCVTIEDAACSFGATRKGRQLGTFGDFGVFSFENWKRLPAFRGGAISVNNDRLFDPARLDADPLVPTTSKTPSRECIAALIRNVSTIPWLYGRLVLPVLLRAYFQPQSVGGRGGPVTNGAPYTRSMHPYQAQLILRMLGRMDQIRAHIAKLTSLYTAALRTGAVTKLLPFEMDDAGLLRYPIAFSGMTRAEALRRALSRGLYLETEFEQPLPDESERGRFPNAFWAGENVVLLPLYSSLSLSSAAWLARQVTEVAIKVQDLPSDCRIPDARLQKDPP